MVAFLEGRKLGHTDSAWIWDDPQRTVLHVSISRGFFWVKRMHFAFASGNLSQLDSIQEDNADKSQGSRKQQLLSHCMLCDITISCKISSTWHVVITKPYISVFVRGQIVALSIESEVSAPTGDTAYSIKHFYLWRIKIICNS